jgi:hypothetical protein
MHLGSALFRRSAFDNVGLFDESMKYSEGWDWFMRAKELHVSMKAYKEVTYYYRRHNKSVMNDTKTSNQFLLRMLRQSLHRRRHQGNGEVTQLPRLSDCMRGLRRALNEEEDQKERTGSDG